ncbi:MAG: hypothetical protein ACJAZV_002340 [Roseivirga sp.]|jgi:hypothetical protein
MKLDRVLINATQLFLLFARNLALLALIVIPIVTLFFDFDNRVSLSLGSNFKLDQEMILKIRPEYNETISDVKFGRINFSTSFLKSDVPKYVVLIPLYGGLIFSFFFIQILYKLVDSAREQDFFNMKNTKRMRLMGFGIIIFSLYEKFLRFMSEYYFDKYFELENAQLSGANFSLGFDIFNPIMLGVMILIIAQAFDYGLRLKEEQELTI